MGRRADRENRYRHVDNAPVSSKDPLGLFKLDGSCKCPPFGGEPVEKGASDACDYPKRSPLCARLLADRGKADCFDRRCKDKSGFFGRIVCKDLPCGTTETFWESGGVGTVVLGPPVKGCPAGQGRGYGPTVFHEALHTCGMKDNRALAELVLICSGWRERDEYWRP